MKMSLTDFNYKEITPQQDVYDVIRPFARNLSRSEAPLIERAVISWTGEKLGVEKGTLHGA